MVSERTARAFGDDYQVIRELARGGMGAVYEARHRRTGAYCAIKTVLDAGDARARGRFRREAELLARCDRHPGIVHVHTLGETREGVLYLVLELVRGEGLDRLLEREQPLEPRRAAALARDIARALGFCHGRGIVHRDVKPSNVLIDAEAGGAPRLTDFGLAAARDVERLTRSGAFIGTPYYCAPEQASGQPSGPAADVYSLGAVLFEMLSGVPPIEKDSAVLVLQELLRDEPVRDVRAVAAEVPEGLAHVVARALAKSPLDRYASGDELAADLETWLAGGTIAPPVVRARRRTVVTSAALALALGGGVGIALVGREAAARRSAAAEARGVLGRARATADRVRALAPAALAGSEPEPALAEAARQLDAARTPSTRAGDAALASDVDTLARRIASLRAEAAVARGDGPRALALLADLERMPPAASLTPAERLLRGRAALLAGKAADAEAEANAASQPDPGPELAAAFLELAGDAQLARGDAARAFESFDRVLATTTRRAREIRAKHAAAAFRAGKEDAAFRDLALLADLLANLPEDRSRNAELAALAPALYRRALAAGGGPAADRDLEAAFRLAPPPREVGPAVARAWLRPMADLPASEFLDPTSPSLVEHCRRARRAEEADPAADLRPVRGRLGLARSWAERLSTDSLGRLVELGPQLEAAWPTDPTALWIAAFAGYASHERPRERAALASLRRAVAALPPPAPEPDDDTVELCRAVASLAGFLQARLSLAPADLEFVRPLEERPGPEVCRDLARMARFLAEQPRTGRLEAEALEVRRATRGKVLVQLDPSRGISAGARLFWAGAAPGDVLGLAVPSSAAGSRRVVVAFTTAVDYSVVRVRLAGQELEPRLDLSTPTKGAVPREYRVTLEAGENLLEVELLSLGPGAEDGRFGLDYVAIQDE